MAILDGGKYLGKWKDEERYLRAFKPMVIGTAGELKYVRIGDMDEEFGSDRPYTVRDEKMTSEEKALVKKAKDEFI